MSRTWSQWFAFPPPLTPSLTGALSGAQDAQAKLKDLYTQAQESASRTWVRLDSEYSLSSKAERAGRRAEETWRDVDQVRCVLVPVRSNVLSKMP